MVLFVTWLVASCHQGPAQAHVRDSGSWPGFGSAAASPGLAGPLGAATCCFAAVGFCWALWGLPRGDTIRPAWCRGGVKTWASGLRPLCSLLGSVSCVSAVQVSQSESGSFPSRQTLRAAVLLCWVPPQAGVARRAASLQGVCSSHGVGPLVLVWAGQEGMPVTVPPLPPPPLCFRVESLEALPTLSRNPSRSTDRDWETASAASSLASVAEYTGNGEVVVGASLPLGRGGGVLGRPCLSVARNVPFCPCGPMPSCVVLALGRLRPSNYFLVLLRMKASETRKGLPPP